VQPRVERQGLERIKSPYVAQFFWPLPFTWEVTGGKMRVINDDWYSIGESHGGPTIFGRKGVRY